MSTQRNVAVIVGSLRKESLNRKAARALIALAPAHLKCEIVEIAGMPVYNPDEDETPLAPWAAFRDAMRPRDAVLFVTPEHNRSVPAALKNAIDVGSRPFGKGVWASKPAAIMSVSPGGVGGFGANHHLRQSLVFLDMPCLQQPEAYIGHATQLFASDGSLASEDTRKFFGKFIEAFAGWIERNARA